MTGTAMFATGEPVALKWRIWPVNFKTSESLGVVAAKDEATAFQRAARAFPGQPILVVPAFRGAEVTVA